MDHLHSQKDLEVVTHNQGNRNLHNHNKMSLKWSNYLNETLNTQTNILYNNKYKNNNSILVVNSYH